MQENIRRILSELRSAWRFRWQAVAIVWIVALLGWLIVFVLPDQYEAEARFFVDTTTRLDEVISGITVKADESSQIALVRQAMLSRPLWFQNAVSRRHPLSGAHGRAVPSSSNPQAIRTTNESAPPYLPANRSRQN